MAQSPYKLTDSDVNHASDYLASRLYLIEYQDDVSSTVAAKRFIVSLAS